MFGMKRGIAVSLRVCREPDTQGIFTSLFSIFMCVSDLEVLTSEL